jgi:hypothetical protein
LKDDVIDWNVTLAIIAHNKTKSTTTVFVPRHGYFRVMLIKNKSEENLSVLKSRPDWSQYSEE